MIDKRYRLFSTHLKERFGGRVHKISIDAGFSCPNRGDDRGDVGCLFCDLNGSAATGLQPNLSVARQLQLGREVMERKYRARYFLAYFQPYSNTYAPVSHLRQLYDEALTADGVVGLAIGTRPDCLPEETLDLLADYHRRTYLWLELGLQSIHDGTLDYLRRGHDYQSFLDACSAARQRDLRICAHVILGLPGENRQQVLETADEMARLRIDGIKIHLLHVLSGTPLGDLYGQGKISVLEQDDYVRLVADFIERLHPDTLLQRLTGDGPRERLLAPWWSVNKWEVLNAIDAELERRGTRQGCKMRGRQ
jgi:uncharacterized protein